jgi:hypothetical protein
MDGMNLQASFQNLTQTDRLQGDIHRTPVVNQVQNAEIARQEQVRRSEMPNQADQAEGRITDPKDRKRTFLQSKRKKKSKDKNDPGRSRSPDSGLFIDCEA